ncbi:hypothetical protein Moror_6018, partial [Moniliophthora roreri MCA 2997]
MDLNDLHSRSSSSPRPRLLTLPFGMPKKIAVFSKDPLHPGEQADSTHTSTKCRLCSSMRWKDIYGF